MNDNFIFRGGKHNGKTYGEVKKKDPGYIYWCEQNAPGMLKEKKAKIIEPRPSEPVPRKEPPPDDEVQESSLKPNVDFWNQGPHGKLN